MSKQITVTIYFKTVVIERSNTTIHASNTINHSFPHAWLDVCFTSKNMLRSNVNSSQKATIVRHPFWWLVGLVSLGNRSREQVNSQMCTRDLPTYIHPRLLLSHHILDDDDGVEQEQDYQLGAK